jgi:putative transcriptional regulator
MSRHPAAHRSAPDELLLDYASGSLAEGPALAVALHAALDPAAARTVDRLANLAGAMLDAEADATPFDANGGDAELAKAMARIEGLAVDPRAKPRAVPEEFGWAPAPLHRYLRPGMEFRRRLGGFEEMPLDISGHRVSLLRLMPGKGLPMHRHTGEEFSVVLQGGYTDETGNYDVGAFAVGPGPNEHQPIADPGEPCVALIVLENPIVLTGPAGRFFNPLVKRGIL